MSNNKQENQHQISGKVIHIGNIEQFTGRSGNTINSRQLVLEVFKGNRRNEVPFDFYEMNTICLKDLKEEAWVTISFMIGGYKREKDGAARWYSNLEGLTVIKG